MAGSKIGYLTIQNFRYGLDARRSELTSQPGTLLRAIDCHINQGAEAEKRKAFVKTSLPNNVFLGLPILETQLAFGSIAPPAMPGGFTYQQLTSPLGGSMTSLIGATLFNGQAFVVAQFTDGVWCFFNAVLVSDFTAGVVLTGQTATTSQAANLAALVNATTNYTATVTGSTVTISGTNQATYTSTQTLTSAYGILTSAQNNQPTPSSAAVAPIGGFQIYAGNLGTGTTLARVYSVGVTNDSLGGIPPYGQTITSGPVQWQGDTQSTAAAIAANINANALNNGGYTATSNGGSVSIFAPIGVTYNGYDVSVAGEDSTNYDGGIVFQNCSFAFALPVGATCTVTNISSSVSGNLTTTSRASSSYSSIDAWLNAIASDIMHGAITAGQYAAAANGNSLCISYAGDTTEAPIKELITVTFTAVSGATVNGAATFKVQLTSTPATAPGSIEERSGAVLNSPGSPPTITASVTGGTAPYTYSWSAPAGISLSNTNQATVSYSVVSFNFTGGTITCTVVDANNAVGTASLPVKNTTVF